MSRYCTKCGKEQTDDAVFCSGCGSRVTPPDAVNTNQPPVNSAPYQNMYYQQPYQNYQSYQNPQYGRYNQPYSAPPQTKNNVMAIAGFILSCASVFTGISCIIGLVLSIVGLSQIKKSHESGKGLAIAGIIISSVMIVLGIIFCLAVVFSDYIPYYLYDYYNI